MSRTLAVRGDSIAAGYGLSDAERATNIAAAALGYGADVNYGVQGMSWVQWTSAMQLARSGSYDSRYDTLSAEATWATLTDAEPDVCIIILEHNDAQQGTLAGDSALLRATVTAQLNVLLALYPNTWFYVVGLLEFGGYRVGFSFAEWRSALEDGCTDTGSSRVVYLDPVAGLPTWTVATDCDAVLRVHPTAAGAAKIATWLEAEVPSAYSLGLRIPDGAYDQIVAVRASEKCIIRAQASASSGTVNTVALETATPGPYFFLAPRTWVPGEKPLVDMGTAIDVDTATASQVAYELDAAALELEKGAYAGWLVWGADASGDAFDRHEVQTVQIVVT